MRVREGGIAARGGAVVDERRLVAAVLLQDAGEIEPGLDVRAVRRDRRLVAGARGGAVAVLLLERAQVAVGVGEVGIALSARRYASIASV